MKDKEQVYLNGKANEDTIIGKLLQYLRELYSSITGNSIDENDYKKICKTYLDNGRIGWSSDSGDSGSGWYEVDYKNKTAILVGTVSSGAAGATLENIPENSSKGEYYFDENNYLCIKNYRVLDLFKGTLVTSINIIEKRIQDFLGKETTILNTFSNKSVECSLIPRPISRVISRELYSQRELHNFIYLNEEHIEERKKRRIRIGKIIDKLKEEYLPNILENKYYKDEDFAFNDKDENDLITLIKRKVLTIVSSHVKEVKINKSYKIDIDQFYKYESSCRPRELIDTMSKLREKERGRLIQLATEKGLNLNPDAQGEESIHRKKILDDLKDYMQKEIKKIYEEIETLKYADYKSCILQKIITRDKVYDDVGTFLNEQKL
jgi:hypothetical protein